MKVYTTWRDPYTNAWITSSSDAVEGTIGGTMNLVLVQLEEWMQNENKSDAPLDPQATTSVLPQTAQGFLPNG